MDSALICSLCYTHYDSTVRTPRFLPCGHTFCSECLNSLLSHEAASCPEDDSPITSITVESLPLNKTLLKMLCQSPLHAVCPLHKKKLELICMEEKVQICSHCALIGEHRTHTVKDITEVNKEISMRIHCMMDMIELIDKTETEINAGIMQQIKTIAASYKQRKTQLGETLKGRFRKARKQLDKLESAAHAALHYNSEYIESQLMKAQEIPKSIYEEACKWKKLTRNTLESIGAKSEDPNYIALELLSSDNGELFQAGEKILTGFEIAREINLNSIQQLADGLTIECDDLKIRSFCTIPALPLGQEQSPELFFPPEVLETTYSEAAYKGQLLNLAQSDCLKVSFVRAGDLRDKCAELAELLGRHSSLEEVCFSCNNLPELGAVSVFKSLQQLQSLRKLKVSYNPLGQLAILSLCELLRSNSNLAQLTLKGNPCLSAEQQKSLNAARNNSTEIIY